MIAFEQLYQFKYQFIVSALAENTTLYLELISDRCQRPYQVSYYKLAYWYSLGTNFVHST